MGSLRLHWMTHPPAAYTAGAVTVGNFDGVHRGHRELLAAARRWADKTRGPAVAVTFDPPPVNVLWPDAARLPLATLAERVERLVEAGADHVAVLDADAGLLSLSPEAFFEDVLVGLFRARAVVEGYNFRFGRARAGGTAELRRLCAAAGVAFEEVPPLLVAGEAVSSSRVRALLGQGEVRGAAALLGRRYAVTARVVPGARRGRTIGFPTANLAPTETLLPADGVYAVRAIVEGVAHPAAANVGPNPTFDEGARKVEVHLIGYAGDLYGRPLTAEFVARLRETRPFAGVAELTEQLARDITAAKAACEESV